MERVSDWNGKSVSRWKSKWTEKRGLQVAGAVSYVSLHRKTRQQHPDGIAQEAAIEREGGEKSENEIAAHCSSQPISAHRIHCIIAAAGCRRN